MAGDYVNFTDLLPENIAEQIKDDKDNKKKTYPSGNIYRSGL